MAYLTILAIGGFGLLIAGVSHYFVSRERRAILAAQAQSDDLASDAVVQNEFVKAAAASVLTQSGKRGGMRVAHIGAKHYSKRVGFK